MRRRCEKPKDKFFKNYGARGIAVCHKWSVSFPEFFADMGASYAEGLTLERIDNDGNYCPENCRWVPRAEQLINTRKNRFLEIDGRRQHIQAWSREAGIDGMSIRYRLRKGMSPRDAVFLPKNQGQRLPL